MTCVCLLPSLSCGCVLLPSLSCVSFCCRHSRALPGNPVLGRIHRTGFPPSARMTAGEGDGHSYLLARMTCACLLPSLSCGCVLLPSLSGVSFCCRHSRALPGNPVLGRIHRTGFPPSARMTAGRAMVIPTFPREQRSGFPPLARMMGRHHPTGFVRSAERIRQGCETMSWCIRGRCQCLAHVCRLCKTVFCNSPCNDLEQPQCVCRLCKTVSCKSPVPCVNSVDSRNHSGILAKRPFRRPVIAGSIICLSDCYTSFLEAKTIVS